MKNELDIFLEINVNELLKDVNSNKDINLHLHKKSNVDYLSKKVSNNYGRNSYFRKRFKTNKFLKNIKYKN